MALEKDAHTGISDTPLALAISIEGLPPRSVRKLTGYRQQTCRTDSDPVSEFLHWPGDWEVKLGCFKLTDAVHRSVRARTLIEHGGAAIGMSGEGNEAAEIRGPFRGPRRHVDRAVGARRSHVRDSGLADGGDRRLRCNRGVDQRPP